MLRELTENMRQAGDLAYAQMMSRFRIASPTDDDIREICKRFVSVLNGKGKTILHQ